MTDSELLVKDILYVSMETLCDCAGDFKIGLELFGTASLNSVMVNVGFNEKSWDNQGKEEQGELALYALENLRRRPFGSRFNAITTSDAGYAKRVWTTGSKRALKFLLQ